jgi:hypothetical protein
MMSVSATMTLLLGSVAVGIAAYEYSMVRLKRRHEKIWRELKSPEPIWTRGTQQPSQVYFQFVVHAEFLKLGDVTLTILCSTAYVSWVSLILGMAYGLATQF